MRRKNMLALGLSAVLCTGLFAPASYADSIDTKDSYVPEVETSSEKNSFETASAVEGLDDFPEETAMEGKTVSIEEEVPTTEAEDSEELAERKSESTEDSKEDIGGTESTVATSGYSGFRSAAVTRSLDNKIIMVTVSFEDWDFPARDHMKVHREKKVNVTGIALRGGEVGVINNPSPDLYQILPTREVEKKVVAKTNDKLSSDETNTITTSDGQEFRVVATKSDIETGFDGLAVAPIVNGEPDYKSIAVIAAGTDSGSPTKTL